MTKKYLFLIKCCNIYLFIVNFVYNSNRSFKKEFLHISFFNLFINHFIEIIFCKVNFILFLYSKVLMIFYSYFWRKLNFLRRNFKTGLFKVSFFFLFKRYKIIIRWKKWTRKSFRKSRFFVRHMLRIMFIFYFKTLRWLN